jgi:uncharacterized membrane protein
VYKQLVVPVAGCDAILKIAHVLPFLLFGNGPIISIATFLNGSDTTGTEISGTLLFFGLLTDF